ncbi:MAG: outer membrane beta-barrel protein [Cytophagaceae bacterium]
MNFFYILIPALLIHIQAFCQDFIPGIRIGVNACRLKSDEFSGSPRIGLDAGFTFTAVMGDKLDIISEMTFSQKGATLKGYDISGSDINYKMYYNSLQYAAIFNYYIKAPNLSLQAGPFFAYNLATPKSEAYFGKTKDPLTDISAETLADGITGLDVGPALGISGGTESVRLNARIMPGMINYFKKVDYNGLGYKVTGATIHFSVSYLFNNVRVTR